MKKFSKLLKRYKITELNPEIVSSDQEYVLIKMNQPMGYNQALALLEENLCRAATFEELQEFEDWDKENPIIAAGDIRVSPSTGKHCVHVLGVKYSCDFNNNCKRSVDLKLLDIKEIWKEGHYLLAVKYL